jgi:hypothetical protein
LPNGLQWQIGLLGKMFNSEQAPFAAMKGRQPGKRRLANVLEILCRFEPTIDDKIRLNEPFVLIEPGVNLGADRLGILRRLEPRRPIN